MTDTATETGNKQSLIKQRRDEHFEAAFQDPPPFPLVVLVEMANVCNHGCTFCAYSKMTRPANVLDPELFERVMAEAYDAGAKEVGLYSGAEPFTSKYFTEFVRISKKLGYTYIYTTTNGSLPKQDGLKKTIDAGLDSIKFSVNGGDPETYKLIHGKDHFELVINNIKFVSEYRKSLDRPFYLAVSFVECADNAHTYQKLEQLLAPYVDEFDHHLAVNQSGQMPHLPFDPPKTEICPNPFNRFHISAEGYMRACCNDYQNMLALEDLRNMSVMEAWHGQTFKALRQHHLDGTVEGTLCFNCLNGCSTPIQPIRPELGDWGQI